MLARVIAHVCRRAVPPAIFFVWRMPSSRRSCAFDLSTLLARRQPRCFARRSQRNGTPALMRSQIAFAMPPVDIAAAFLPTRYAFSFTENIAR